MIQTVLICEIRPKERRTSLCLRRLVGPAPTLPTSVSSVCSVAENQVSFLCGKFIFVVNFFADFAPNLAFNRVLCVEVQSPVHSDG